MITINIAKDFSTTPGLRYRHQSDFSGEQFREELLAPKFEEVLKAKDRLQVILDGTNGYTTSFLDESFGGLARDKGKNIVEANLELVSKEEEYLISDIHGYIAKANFESKGKTS